MIRFLTKTSRSILPIRAGHALSVTPSMASQSRKYRGFSTERVVARYLSEWWPHADIGRGAGKDITMSRSTWKLKLDRRSSQRHGSTK
jgi:hypothetical protein